MSQQEDRRNERIEDERIENMEYDPSEDVESSDTEIIDEEDLNPDFERPTPSDSDFESSETAEPWTPPTDPVIQPAANDQGGAQVVGEMNEPGVDDDIQQLIPQTDEDLGQNVVDALKSDAETADLDLRVLVRDGVVTLRGKVPSLDDSDAAEEVAGRVPGVREVHDETDVEAV